MAKTSGQQKSNSPTAQEIKNGQKRGQDKKQGQQTGQLNDKNAQRGNENKKEQSPQLEKFFISELKDIYHAEHQLLQALPEMKEAATTEELQDAFDKHLEQTKRHVSRLEKVFKTIGKEAEGKPCEAMIGLIKEAHSIIGETNAGSMTRDAALIIAAQKVEHYEIATYGGLVQLAITMDLTHAAELLEKTLNEEEDTDRLLTDIAESSININADNEGVYSWKAQKEAKEIAE